MKLAYALLLFFGIPCCSPAQPSASSSPLKLASCKINTVSLSPAKIASMQGEFKVAADLFTTERAAHPDDNPLHAAQIRNLLGKGDLDEATAQATAWTTKNPDSGTALATKAEATLRSGNLPEAYAEAARSQKIDPCNGRVYYVLSEYEDMIALHGTEKPHIDLAHALDPMDPEITEFWISTRPRDQARKEWANYIETAPRLTDKQREGAKKYLVRQAGKPPDDDCRLVSPVQETTVPFSPIRYSSDAAPAYGLEMTFNGKKRRLELDTGASGLTLTAGAAERLGLVTEDTIMIGGIGDGGNQVSRVTHIARLKVGGLEFADCRVYILPARNMDYAVAGNEPMMANIDGLVGGDLFRKFLLTLDYPGGEMKVSPLPPRPGEPADMSLVTESFKGRSMQGSDAPMLDHIRSPEMQDWTQFYRIYHYLLIPTQLNDGPVKLMMADTGAGVNIISPAAARTVTQVRENDRIFLTGLSGRTGNTYLTGRIVLHFAQLYLPLPWMVATETTGLSKGAGVEIAGFLGFPALRQMTLQIDYRDGLIHFAFDPKRSSNPKFERNALNQ